MGIEIGKDKVNVEFLGHAGFCLSLSDGKRLVIDPYNVPDSFDEKADILLITHSHFDHCSIKDIERISKPGMTVICTADCQSKITKIDGLDMHVVEVGDKIDLAGIKVEVVAAYNKHKDYHPKSEGWVGYMIKIKDVVVYHAGDTDFIPEMQKLSGHGKKDNEFVALLPVSGKSVMNAEQAADAASVISPDVVIPMHYGAGVAGTIDDARHFADLCKENNIKAEILEKV